MRRIRVTMTVLMALAVLAMLAGPAAANSVGLLGGKATVGKDATVCRHDGSSDVSGAGIGLPVINPPKQAYYQIDTNDPFVLGGQTIPGANFLTVVNLPGKPNMGASNGRLRACGQLDEVGKAPAQIGAACGMSKGDNGKGRVSFNSGPKDGLVYSLHDITWKASAGGTFPFWASGQPGAIGKGASGRDLVVGVIQAFGLPECTTKSNTQPKLNGGKNFAVLGAFAIINNGWVMDPQDVGGNNATPVICKRSGTNACLYEDKKNQTPKS